MHVEGVPEHAEAGDDEQRGRRRGRRGGRRRRHDGNGEMPPHAEPGADQPDLPPVYTGPTPANPFGGQTFDIFDVLEQAEAAAPARRRWPLRRQSRRPRSSWPNPRADRRPSATDDETEPGCPRPVLAESAPVQAEPPRARRRAGGAEPEPEPVMAANDAALEPAIKPIIIGAEQDVVVEKKRGWWRR